MNGICTHDGNSGVNFYVDGGLETFTPGDKWIQLELYISKAKHLKSGRQGRYCITGPAGELCQHCEVRALLVHRSNLPPLMRIA